LLKTGWTVPSEAVLIVLVSWDEGECDEVTE